MKEHRIILDDLQIYLKNRGIETGVAFRHQLAHHGAWRIADNTGYDYLIIDNNLVLPLIEGYLSVVSLADPEYREKFYEFFKSPFDRRWSEFVTVKNE